MSASLVEVSIIDLLKRVARLEDEVAALRLKASSSSGVEPIISPESPKIKSVPSVEPRAPKRDRRRTNRGNKNTKADTVVPTHERGGEPANLTSAERSGSEQAIAPVFEFPMVQPVEVIGRREETDIARDVTAVGTKIELTSAQPILSSSKVDDEDNPFK